ncbi:MAG: hypothetical protein IJZ68_07715 [Bacteroidaceae bacterium]|nr:hypothetical protein [Bacteroidaceae bacterium]
MKVRLDFVTNSSSSSFILAYDSREDALAQLAKKAANFPEHIGIILRDVERAPQLTEAELTERLEEEADHHAYWIMHYGEGGWWSNRKPTWENLWIKRNPDKDRWQMYEDPEYQAEKKRLKDQYLEAARKKLEGKSFVIEIEYSDNDGTLFSELEHDIMPQMPGLVESFNHH